METSVKNMMFINKHKVAFYLALVILLFTLGQSVDATEVISHSSPKITSTDVTVIRGYDGNKGISEKLTKIRQLFRSLIFDWNLGESGVDIGRTFGRIRMMKNIFLPVAFIGGFLTAVIFSIKAIGVANLLLISAVLALNLAMILGKLLYVKALGQGQTQTHYHSHYNQQLYPSPGPSYGPPSYGGYGPYGSGSYASASASSYADRRTDNRYPFSRDLKSQPPIVPTGPSSIPSGPAFPQQINNPIAPTMPAFAPTANAFPNPNPAFTNQASPNYSQQMINAQNPTAFNNNQQPPPSFRPQMNIIPQSNNNNPFSGLQMQSPQQVQQQQPTFNQPFNQLLSQMQDTGFLNNDIAATQATTPSIDVEMINLQEIKPQSSFSPLEMEQILTNALARISESKRAAQTTALPNLFRFKRKSSNHQQHLNLLRPFS